MRCFEGFTDYIKASLVIHYRTHKFW